MSEENLPIGNHREEIHTADDLSKSGAGETCGDVQGGILSLKGIPPIAQSFAPQFYRPVQYLGNKIRSLPDILIEAASFGISNSTVYDLFSGTSVVSQAFANLGCKIVAVDAQQSCQTMALSLLGVGRGSRDFISDSCSEIAYKSISYDLEFAWKDFVQEEDAAIKAADAIWLRDIYARLPTVWHPNDDFGPLKTLTSGLKGQATGVAPLFALTLAGSYFGIRQALAIDALRWAIGDSAARQRTSPWQTASLLTALMTAMSEAVYSAGKHFAQPLTAGVARDGKFRQRRMLKDRSIDITQEFLRAVTMIEQCARKGGEGHAALAMPAEEALDNSQAIPKLVYADPPYTAQQYSRFYHALETLISYQIPSFDRPFGMTSGLYPPGRYKSAFSSKRKAPKAFEKIISACQSKGANLLLSYSMSHNGSDGNDRMIDLENLLKICKHYYQPSLVEVVELNHSYRQFNSGAHSNAGRNDPELLIVCRF